MSSRVSDEQMEAKSRPGVIALIVLTLRLMENWRAVISLATSETLDADSGLIVLAVVAIGAEKFTRDELEPELGSLAAKMPPGRLSRCNVTSIAAATGIKRETVRRKVLQLQALGILEKVEPDGIRVSAAFAARPEVRSIVQAQVDAVVRATNQLRSFGILEGAESPNPRNEDV